VHLATQAANGHSAVQAQMAAELQAFQLFETPGNYEIDAGMMKKMQLFKSTKIH
jgi:hypothetical protein